jgi:glycosyltransferase involved in cell wall biosynthesis
MQKIAVVTVCYNAINELKLTVNSVQSQNHAEIVHIIIDGASTDGTVPWLELEQANSEFWLSEPDLGIYDAMNKSLKFIQESDWVIFLNAGDSFASNDVIKKLLPVMERTNVDFIFGSVQVVVDPDTGSSVNYKARLNSKDQMPGCHQSCLVRRGILNCLGFNINYKIAADLEIWQRATVELKSQTTVSDITIARVAPEGYSARNELILRSEYHKIIAQYRSRFRADYWLVRRILVANIKKIFSYAAKRCDVIGCHSIV